MRPIHEYFENFEILVNNVFPIILIVFVAINIGALVYIFFRHRDEMSASFGKALWLNILGLIGIFAVCSVVFSCVNFFSEQDYNLFSNYYNGYATQEWLLITVSIISAIAGIYGAYSICDNNDRGIVAGIIIGVLIAGVTFAVLMYIVGFIVYVVIWFIWLVLRLIWLIVGSFGLSIYQFVITYWLICILTLAIPACGIGLYTAGKGLYESISFSPQTSGYPKYRR